ncbi:MAG: PH domain-containing protein [Candidatus Omnitrophica bacterium]|nr:PH domain-containing protein [Candidatus Omnitrophota bacterium]
MELFLGVRIAFLAGFAGLYFAYGSAYLDGILLYAFSGIYAALVTISFIAISLQAGASMLRSKLSGVLTKAQLVYTWMIALLVDTAIPFVAYFATSNTLWLYTGYIVSGIVTLEGLLVLIAVTRKPQAQSLESSSEGTKPNSAEISSSPTRGPPQSSTSPALITDVKYDPITAREIWRVVLALLAAAALFKEALTYGVIGLVGIVAGAPLAITTIIGLIGLILAAVLGGRRFYLWISLDSSTTQPRRVALWQQIVLWGAIGLFSAFMTGVLVKLFGSWGLWGALGWEPRNIILPKAAEGLSPQDWAGIVIFFIAAAIFAPIVEEISNRAGYYDGIKRGLGDKKISRTIAVVISSLLFAALHIPSWGFYPDTFLFHLTGGIVLALAYQLSGSLWVAIGTHAILNGMQIVTGLAKIGSIPSVYPTLAITLMAIITFSAIVSYYKNKSKVQITGDKETVSNRVSSSSSKDDSPDLTIKPKKSAFIHYRLAKRLLITVFILAALHLSLEFALIYSAREFPVLAGYPFLPAAVWLLFPLIAGWLYLLLKIRYSKEKYLFYSDRIVHQGGGILSNFETEVKAVNITHASLYLPFVENKLLRTGYVNIDSAGGRNAEITLSSVAEAEKVYQKLIETMQQNGFKLARQKLIQQERPHTFAVFLEVSQAYILRIYALFVFFAPFLFGFAVLISDLGLKELGFIYIALFSAGGLLVLGVVVTSYVVAFLDARRRVYQLYDDTVVFSEGFLNKHYAFMPIENVTDTTLGATFIERIFGLSDLMISSQGAEQEIKFNNMVNGHEFLENVRSLIAQRKDTAAKDSVAKQIPSGREVRSPARARQPAVPADRSYTAEFKMHPLRTWLPVILATPLLIFVFPLWIVLIAGVIITLANTRFRVKSDAIERDFIVKSWYSYFFSRALRQFSLDKVTGIVFKENLLDKLTKTFSILFWSIGSGKDITFSNIKKEEGLKEKILAKKGIGQQKEIYRLTPRYTIFAMLKANIYLVGLAAIAVSVATIFFPPYGWISLPMAGLVFLATFIYRKIYYWNSLMVFYEDYVYFKRGIFFKQEYYVLYDDIRDITTTKYPLSNKGKITFNIAGETIIETKDGKFRFSNDFTVGYVDGISTLDELIDQIFFKRPSLEQIKAIEKNLKDTSTKPDYKAKPALTNYLAFIIPALLMINAGLIAAVNFMPQMVEELLVELPLALQSTQLLITAAGLLSIFIVVGVVIVIRSISYNFQPYRVFTRWGVIFKKQSSVTFDKIDFINFNQGPMNKLFGTGNIVISTTGSSEPQLVIRNIKDFKQFYNILKEDYHKPQSDPASSSSPTRAPPRLVRGDIVVWMIMVAGLIVASLGGLPQSWSLFLDKLALIAGLKIIPIIISPLALIPALFITYYVFKSTKKSRYLILVPLALVAIIFVHELGHALAATYFGAKVSAIELGMFGAVTKLAVVKGVPALSGLENILVYSAGPATHLLWIVPLVIFGRKSFGRGLIYYNLYLLVFNLLPFGLRDGGQIIALAKAVESISAYWFFTSLWAVIGLVSLIVFASSPTVKAGAKKLAAKVNIFPDVTVVKALVFVFALDFIFIVSVYSLPVGLLIALFSNLYLGLGIVLAASGLLALGIRILRKAAEAKVSLLRVALLALVVNVLADFTAAMIAPAITLPVLIAVQGLSFSGNIALSTAYVSSGLVAAVVMYYLINKAISALQTAVENKGLPLIRIALLILGADLLIFGLAALAAAFPAGLGLLAGILKGPLVSVGLTLGTAFAVSGLLLTGMGMSVIKAMVELINREDKTLGILVQEAFSSQSSSSTAAAEPAMESLRGPLSGNRVREMLKQRVKYDLEAKGVKLVEPRQF